MIYYSGWCAECCSGLVSREFKLLGTGLKRDVPPISIVVKHSTTLETINGSNSKSTNADRKQKKRTKMQFWQCIMNAMSYVKRNFQQFFTAFFVAFSRSGWRGMPFCQETAKCSIMMCACVCAHSSQHEIPQTHEKEDYWIPVHKKTIHGWMLATLNLFSLALPYL